MANNEMFFVLSEPRISIEKPLQNIEAPVGDDATFNIELSSVAPGTWFIKGKAVQNCDNYKIERTKNVHTLIIKQVRSLDNEAEVKFIARNAESTAKLRVKGEHYSEWLLVILSFLLFHYYLLKIYILNAFLS